MQNFEVFPDEERHAALQASATLSPSASAAGEPFVPVGSYTEAVVLRLQGRLPRIRVLTIPREEDQDRQL